jgi:hypothetical protein
MSEALRSFLIALASDPERSRRFTTDAKVLASELTYADLSAEEKLAILSRDSRRIQAALGDPRFAIIRVLDWFDDGSRA